MARASSPTGRLMKKIQRQEKLSVIQPPRVGPITGATTTPRPYTAMAVACLRGGKLSSRIAWDSGSMPPPPSPCRIRAAMSMGMLMARPHSMEAAVNTRMEISISRLRPILRAIQPVAGSMMALDTR